MSVGGKIAGILTGGLIWLGFFIVFSVLVIKNVFGEVSLPQVLYFVKYGWTGVVDMQLVGMVLFFCGVLPVALTLFLTWFLKHNYKKEVLFGKPSVLLAYLVLLWFAVNSSMVLTPAAQCELYAVLFMLYVLNMWQNADRWNLFVAVCLAFGLVFCVVKRNGGERLFLSFFDFGETDFYARRYVEVGQPSLNEQEKRNVIVVFAESFENRFSQLNYGPYVVKVRDEQAVKFADLTSGYGQTWSQGALFSAFSGVHIHYLSESLKYALYDKIKYDGLTTVDTTNKIGENFDFKTPHIRYLGDILAENGYTNLFVKGGDSHFSGTYQFLVNHSFSAQNVYDLKDFTDTESYYTRGSWWGVKDDAIYALFKQKIMTLDKTKPFFAVMFTLDFHGGLNPFYASEREKMIAAIVNLNDFIGWFEQQDFYKNTTLIVVADHKKMGEGAVVGGDLYNAFFNLPERFLYHLNLNRRFNQIDMFPTILEIAGFELPERKAGMGVSLFSGEKTLAEEYSYDEQEAIFSKIDRFYQNLWRQ